MQLSLPCKYSNHQKIPHCPRHPPVLSRLLLTSRRGRGTMNSGDKGILRADWVLVPIHTLRTNASGWLQGATCTNHRNPQSPYKNFQAPGAAQYRRPPPNFSLQRHLLSPKPEQGAQELALYSKSHYCSSKNWPLTPLNFARQILAKRRSTKVRSQMQQEGAGSRKGRSALQLRSCTGQKAHRQERQRFADNQSYHAAVYIMLQALYYFSVFFTHF